MADLTVSLLGKFEMTRDGESVLGALGSSRKKTSLLQYLLVNHDEPFTNQDLFEHLWGDDDSTNPSSGLNTLVSRLRKDLKPYGLSDILTMKNGVYRWNREVYDEIDIYTFERLAAKLLEADTLDEGTRGGFEQVITLYKGDLLAASDTATWVVPKSMHYHTLYLKVCHKYVELLTESGAHDEVLRVARRGLEIDQFDSRLNLELVNAMLALGMKAEAMNHYNYAISAHGAHPGLDPSDDMLEFYRKQIQVEYNSEAILDAVSRDLQRDDGDRTAFVCDYTIFKDIYNINMRNLQRLGITMFLGVLTLSRTTEAPRTQRPCFWTGSWACSRPP